MSGGEPEEFNAGVELSFIQRLAKAPTLESLPALADPLRSAPLNPPRRIQQQFVGSSYLEAYAEAERFIDAAFEHWPTGSPETQTVLDFGAGWGRITRMLLRRFSADQIWSSDVDSQMTALLQSTLPGVNSVTNAPMPPTVFRNGMFDAVVAFSVFSHLSQQAHLKWACEFGRLTRPGGRVYITVLEEHFLTQIAAVQLLVAEGRADPFATNLAKVVPDAAVALEEFRAGTFIFGGGGDDGPRSESFYGWAAAPRPWVEKIWAAAGFVVESWIPTGQLFEQAMVTLVRMPPVSVSARVRNTLRLAAGRVRNRLRRLRSS